MSSAIEPFDNELSALVWQRKYRAAGHGAVLPQARQQLLHRVDLRAQASELTFGLRDRFFVRARGLVHCVRSRCIPSGAIGSDLRCRQGAGRALTGRSPAEQAFWYGAVTFAFADNVWPINAASRRIGSSVAHSPSRSVEEPNTI